MNNSSPRILRSGKIIASTSLNVTIESTNTQNSNMENNDHWSNEKIQSGRKSPTNESDLQQANEERFNHPQSEMATLKTMMERLIAQNEERNRQLDASAATSSFVVRSSNIHLVLSLVHGALNSNRMNFVHVFEGFCNSVLIIIS